jgi:hypothetical protein
MLLAILAGAAHGIETEGFGIAVDDAQAGAIFGLAVRDRLFADSYLLRHLHCGSRDRAGVRGHIAAAACGQQGEEGSGQGGAEYGSFHNAGRKDFVGNGAYCKQELSYSEFFFDLPIRY